MSSTEKMDVEMIDGLAAVGSGVDDQAVAVAEALLARDLTGCPQQMTEEIGVSCRGVRVGRDVLFGDHQQMRGRLRVDVRKGQHAVVFVDAVDGNGAGGDLAEEAVHGSE